MTNKIKTILKKALVIHPIHKENFFLDPNYKLEEAENLARSTNLEVSFSMLVEISQIKAGSFFGSGKIEEINKIIKEKNIDYVIVNDSISSVQQRNLEKIWKIKLIDRTNLILQIFALRAKTSEGKLQVELAQLEYQKSRLVRIWTHLGRQRGKTSFIGGEGETQLEMDKRIIKDKIKKIKIQLEKVKQTRSIQRVSRNKVPYPIIALIGYTNAGKSTLFNLLTGANVEAADKVFATLDPTMRLVKLPSNRKVILSDTVGFISDLPTILIASFRATLEVVKQANIILHVRDFATEETDLQKKDVIKILKQLDIEDKVNYSTVELLNKCDLFSREELEILLDKYKNEENLVVISAKENINIEKLLQIIDDRLANNDINVGLCVEASDGKIISWLYNNSEIINEEIKGNYLEIYLKISEKNFGKLNYLMRAS